MVAGNYNRSVDETPCVVSPDLFRKGMRRFAGVCTIVTSADASRNRAGWVGLTATAVSSVTADPPRILVCVNRSAFAHGTIVSSGILGVNVLAAENGPSMAKRFGGGSGPIAEKFEAEKWILGSLGVPLFKRALLTIECIISDIINNSTHDIIICDVVGINDVDQCDAPLIYFNGTYRSPELSC